MSTEMPMLTGHAGQDGQDKAETSKAGALRMRRLARLTPLIPPATSAVHCPSGQIIYRGATSSLTGHFISSFAPSARPRPLALPPYLGPGKELSISPTGEWIVIFHPAPSTINQTSEGGTLAIYSSSVLSPLALPNNVAPLATFPLPTDVLAIQHIYVPPPAPAPGSAEIAPPTYGPHPPSTYSSSQGPAFIVLTSTGVILFHPQILPPPPGTLNTDVEAQYAYTTLKCPLHTRWYASSGGMAPPDIGRVDRGWAGLIRGDEGVWFAYEDTEVHGILRAEVLIKDGKASLLTTRMPPLPVPSNSIRRVQGVMFASVPEHALPPGVKRQSRQGASEHGGGEDANGDVQMDGAADGNGDEAEHKVGERDGALVGVVVVSRTTIPATETAPVQVQTHIATYAVQRCEVDIVDAFREINGSQGDANEPPAAWDWYALPHALSDRSLPPNTLILALAPLYPLLHPRALALLVTPPNASPLLVHLDLCPASVSGTEGSLITSTSAGAETAMGVNVEASASVDVDDTMGIPIDPELILGISAPCMLSPSAEAGWVGQVGVLDPRKGPSFYALSAVPQPDSTSSSAPTTGDQAGSGALLNGEYKDKEHAAEAKRGQEDVQAVCKAVLEAVRDGEGYADALGALVARTPKDKLPGVVVDILTTSYASFRRDVRVDADMALTRLQVALFWHADDPRAQLASQICRLRSASSLFDACAIRADNGIVFELDAIWPLVPVAEHCISTLSSILRHLITYRAHSAWTLSPPGPSASTSYIHPSLILILHPTLRALILRLLAQLRAFKAFVQALDKPILQPESKFAPAPSVRDPRATIVARERIGDLGWKDGVDIILWGKGLVGLEKKAQEQGAGDAATDASDVERVTVDDADRDRALIELKPDLLGDSARKMLEALPCPSDLLLAPSFADFDASDDTAVDGITFLPLSEPDMASPPSAGSRQNDDVGVSAASGAESEREREKIRRVRCDQCGTRTEALGWTRGPGMNMGMFGIRYAAGLGGSHGWNGWRGAREKGCICGGAWTR